ncbi:conjugative transfer relaxase/helicase TraI [Aliivibrio fischeri]|uniref:Conjugative transfer relaxase/helicase TraI n=1 Tax=Aliivibrio fischeri TaxID=668 RepID=A0A510UR30_ALIFS|nr:conjugative transfer relaxase/helicase TraI [Aliivibrio fischeri]GEK15901.1 hypothetical protein AFI02nite_39370 [Aliivibrio fischeri]
MLSLSPIRGGASGASNYYLAEEKNLHIPQTQFMAAEPNNPKNYYLAQSHQQETGTQWFGEIAKKEGIDGQPITEQKLEQVLRGELSENNAPRHGSEHRRTGYDLTFSAPKGASILGLVYCDTRILESHTNAVKTALSQMEKDAAQSRHVDGKTQENRYDNTQNLLFGLVPHKTSREEEPQIHTHALMANMTYSDNGELKNLATCTKQNEFELNGTYERLLANQKYYTMIYQSELGRDLEKMGYTIKSLGKGLIDIDGIPQHIIDTNSTRRQQILEHVDTLGIDSGKSKDIAAQATRKAKTYTPEDSLLHEWQRKNEALGFDGLSFVAASFDKEKPEIADNAIPQTAIDAVEKSLSHLGTHTSQLSYERILTMAAHDFSYGQHHDIIALKTLLDAKIKSGELIPLTSGDGTKNTDSGVLYTTQHAVNKEKQLIDSTSSRTRGLNLTPNEKSLNDMALSGSHRDTVTDILKSTKAINLVSLSGSSQILSEALLHVGTESGRNVRFVTPNALTKQEHQSNVSRQSFSVTQWIKNQFRRDHVEHLYGFLSQPPEKHGKDQLIIVEHAHKLGLNEVQSLVDHAKAQQSKLVFLQNPNARQSYKAGNAMETLQKGDVMNINWSNKKENQTHVLLHEEAKKDTRHEVITQRYAALNENERKNVALYSTGSRDTENLNISIRNALDKVGKLSEQRIQIDTFNPVYLSKEQQSIAKSYQVGMRMTEFVDKKPHHYEITKINAQSNTLILKNEFGKEQAHNVGSKAFTDRQFSVAKPNTLEIAAGDLIAINGNLFGTELKKNDVVQVDKMSWYGISLKDQHGTSHLVSSHDLHHAPLDYGYAKPLSTLSDNKENIWVDMPSYTASKETFNDLLDKETNTLTLFTDNKDKLENQLGKSRHQPSAISSVMLNGQAIEKYINAETKEALFQDVAIISKQLSQSLDKSHIDKAVSFAIGHISEQKAGFKHNELVMAAIRYSLEEMGMSITKGQINAKLSELENKGDLLSAQYNDGTRWTTKEVIMVERDILTRFENTKDSLSALTTPREAKQYLAQHDWLSEGQKEGITLLATTTDQFVGVQGFAGVGKSTMLEQGIALVHHVQELKNETPINVIGLAPTHTAVNELKEKGVTSQTSQSLLRDFLTGAPDAKKYSNTLFLLDESSMISNAQMNDFGALVEQSGARAVMLGDMYQLQSKEAGKPFELAFKRGAISSIVMKDIKRQQDPTLLAAVHHVIDKQPHSVMANLKAQASLPNEQYHSLPQHANQQVISTFTNETGSLIKDKELAKTRLYDLAATEYLSRTPESRDNTLMIAYSHRERDLLASLIRPGLQKMNELDKNEHMITRLRGVGATKEELKTMMPYKSGLIVHTQNNEYLMIDKVDKQHDLLSVTDMTTGESKTFLPKHHDHKMTTLWSQTKMPLSKGDKITWRKTDQLLELKGNTDLTVKEINNHALTMLDENGKTIQLDLNDMRSSHWDYRYTRTADMAQGATVKNVISVISSDAKLTNIRRGYIDITRASEHVKLFTDHEANTIKTWENNHDNNASALETIEKIKAEQHNYFDLNTTPQEDPKYQQEGRFNFPLYAKDVAKQLTPYTESLATHLLGRPNASKSDNDYLVFGECQSHIKVSLTSEYRGYYRDWTTGDKGNLINLIMNTQGMNYKEAIQQAQHYLDAPEKADITVNEKHDELTQTLPKQVGKLKALALDYWEKGRNIEGTPAQTYLEKATGEHITNHENIRFHPNVYSSETGFVYPAMITKLSNSEQQLEAIKITYLNNDGDKAQLNTNKRLMGNKSTHSVAIHEGHNNEISVITIGLETAVGFSKNNHHDVDIIAVNNLHDIKTVNIDSLREHIIIMCRRKSTHQSQFIE